MKSTRLFFAVAALALIGGAGVRLQAQWSDNPNVSMVISVAMNAQYNPTIVSHGAGRAIVSWTDNRAGMSDIYAQHITGNGVLGEGIGSELAVNRAPLGRADKII